MLPAGETIELFRSEESRLTHHLVDERRLPVVNVSNDRKVAKVVPLHESWLS
jgi:hypothetical protein